MPRKWYKSNLKAARQRYEELKKMGQGGNFWKPQEGENIVRFLPAYKEGAPFYLETMLHFGLGSDNSQTVTCNQFYGQPCYICEVVAKLRESEDPEDLKRARDMAPRRRIFYNIIDLKNPQDGVKVFVSGITIFKQLLSYIYDSDWGDITDPQHGYDIVIERTGTGLDTDYNVKARRSPSPIENEEWLDQLVNLDQFVNQLSYEEQKALVSFPESEEEEENEEIEETKDEEIGEEIENEIERSCFGEYDKRDPECRKCPDKTKCKERFFEIQSQKGSEDDLKKLEDEIKARVQRRAK